MAYQPKRIELERAPGFVADRCALVLAKAKKQLRNAVFDTEVRAWGLVSWISERRSLLPSDITYVDRMVSHRRDGPVAQGWQELGSEWWIVDPDWSAGWTERYDAAGKGWCAENIVVSVEDLERVFPQRALKRTRALVKQFRTYVKARRDRGNPVKRADIEVLSGELMKYENISQRARVREWQVHGKGS